MYELLDEEWIDRGTGFCFGEVIESEEEHDKEKEVDDDEAPPQYTAARIIVKNEINEEEVLLKSIIQGDIQYQKQQDTLIVWTEPKKNDVALSFQEVEGCANLCDFLVYIQNTMERNISVLSVITTDDETEYTELIAGPVNYPPLPPLLENLDEAIECLSLSVINAFYKDLMIKFILESTYIDELLSLFKSAEEKTEEELSYLYNLCRVIKILLLMNDTSIAEILFKNDSNIMTIIGILEYDPDFPNYKLNYREYLNNQTRFNEVIPIGNEEVRLKIVQTYKLQFLKDNILIRLLDDNIFSMLSSIIYFNQLEIIQYFQTSPDNYFKKLFDIYTDQDNNDDSKIQKKRDIVRFIHSLSLVIKGFQHNQRNSLYSNLINNGLFRLIDFALNDYSCNETKILGTELMIFILNQDVNLVVQPTNNGNSNHPKNSNEHIILLFNVLIKLLKNDNDINLKSQICDILKNLFEISIVPMGEKNNSEFVKEFDKVILDLFSPLIEMANNTDEGRDQLLTSSSNISQNTLYQYLSEMLFFFLQHHLKYAIISIKKNGLFLGLRTLCDYHKNNLVRLSAIKCIKQSFMMNNLQLTQLLLDNDMLGPLVNILKTMKLKNNLIHSACLEFFSSLSLAVLSNNYEIPKSTLLLLESLYDNYSTTLSELKQLQNIFPSLETRYKELKAKGVFEDLKSHQDDEPTSPMLPPAAISDESDLSEDYEEEREETDSTIIKHKGSLKRYQALDISDYGNSNNQEDRRPQKRRASKEQNLQKEREKISLSTNTNENNNNEFNDDNNNDDEKISENYNNDDDNAIKNKNSKSSLNSNNNKTTSGIKKTLSSASRKLSLKFSRDKEK